MRRTITVAAIGALALIVAACTPSVTVENTGTPSEGTSVGIAVSGTGKISGAPDTLTMTFGVTALADSVADAVTDSAKSAEAVIAALKAAGVADEDIQTANYSIFPRYDYRNETEILVGYQVENSVVAKIRDLGRAGTLIDDVVSAGGDAVIVSGVSFSIEDNSKLVEAARERAWKDAHAKAQQLADLAGVKLGKPTSISESFTAPPVAYPYDEYRAAMPTGEDAATSIAPGSQEVAVTLSVQFDLAS